MPDTPLLDQVHLPADTRDFDIPQLRQLADELGFLVAYPQQNPAANPQKCWNWASPKPSTAT